MSTPLVSQVLSTRVSQAAEILSHIPGKFADSAQGIDAASVYIWNRLGKLGITNDDASMALIADGFCKEGDARQVFCENGEPNLPVPWFRKAWYILSTGVTIMIAEPPAADPLAQLIKSNRPMDQWSDRELIDLYSVDWRDRALDEAG